MLGIMQTRTTAILCSVALGMALGGASVTQGGVIHLEWRPAVAMAEVGGGLSLGLYAVSSEPQGAGLNSAQVLLWWDPAVLRLTGSNPAGGVGLAAAGFPPNDSWGFNEASPPADGDALWFGFAPLTFPPTELPVSPAGTLLATVEFVALLPATVSEITLVRSGQKPGRPMAHTEVYTGTQNVLGALGAPARVTVVPEPASLLGGVVLLLTRRRLA